MARGVVRAAALLEAQARRGGRRCRSAFITPTYAPGQLWEPGDMSRLLDCYRQWAKRRGIRLLGTWVAEAHTGGGANHGQVHYHLLLVLPLGITPPMPDKQGWWRKGMTNCSWARKAVRYMAKYASKASKGPPLPRGARMWGAVGLSLASRADLLFTLAPRWVQEKAALMDCEGARKLACGWWRIGAWEFRSPWSVTLAPDGLLARFVGWTEHDFEYVP